MKTDMELGQDVEKELAWNSRVAASHITVTTQNRMVTLAGRVQNYAIKCEAGSVVKHIAGVAGLANELEVTSGGAQPNDPDLTQRVLQALEANVFVPSKTIKPVVHDGWVTLSGKALYCYEKLDAENSVRPLRGVKGITDSIVIDTPDGSQNLNQEIPQEIITGALSRNARLDEQPRRHSKPGSGRDGDQARDVNAEGLAESSRQAQEAARRRHRSQVLRPELHQGA